MTLRLRAAESLIESAEQRDERTAQLTQMAGHRALIIEECAPVRRVLADHLLALGMVGDAVASGAAAEICAEAAREAGRPHEVVISTKPMMGIDERGAAAWIALVYEGEERKHGGGGVELLKPIRRWRLTAALRQALRIEAPGGRDNRGR